MTPIPSAVVAAGRTTASTMSKTMVASASMKTTHTQLVPTHASLIGVDQSRFPVSITLNPRVSRSLWPPSLRDPLQSPSMLTAPSSVTTKAVLSLLKTAVLHLITPLPLSAMVPPMTVSTTIWFVTLGVQPGVTQATLRLVATVTDGVSAVFKRSLTGPLPTDIDPTIIDLFI